MVWWRAPSLRLCAALLAATLAGEAELRRSCKNPLFRAHWYSEALDASHLQDSPANATDLERCRMWNNRESCCNPSMEAPQQVAFDSRLQQLEHKVHLLQAYLRSMQDVRRGDIYAHASSHEQALFDRALGAFQPIEALVPKCVHAVMLFVAGMICFGCEPHWRDFVWTDVHGAVTAVNVDAGSCLYVDQHCSAFGKAVQRLTAQVMESVLAKSPPTALPDVSMLKDRMTVCKWLRRTVALQPLRSAVAGERRLASVDPTDPFGELAAQEADEGHAFASLASTTTTAPVTSTPPATTSQQQDVSQTTTVVLQETTDPSTTTPHATRARFMLDPVRDGQVSGFRFTIEGWGV